MQLSENLADAQRQPSRGTVCQPIVRHEIEPRQSDTVASYSSYRMCEHRFSELRDNSINACSRILETLDRKVCCVRAALFPIPARLVMREALNYSLLKAFRSTFELLKVKIMMGDWRQENFPTPKMVLLDIIRSIL